MLEIEVMMTSLLKIGNVMFKYIIYTLAAFYSCQSMAIAVSSLFEVADKDTHIADIKVENNDKQDMFINMEMLKVRYVDGKKVVEKLNRENLTNWDFSVSPSQMILKPGERKTVRMMNHCKDKCDFKEDQVYALDITPVPYYEGKNQRWRWHLVTGPIFRPCYVKQREDRLRIKENGQTDVYVQKQQ